MLHQPKGFQPRWPDALNPPNDVQEQSSALCPCGARGTAWPALAVGGRCVQAVRAGATMLLPSASLPALQ